MIQGTRDIPNRRKAILNTQLGPALPFIVPAILSILFIPISHIFLKMREPFPTFISLITVSIAWVTALRFRVVPRPGTVEVSRIIRLVRELEEKEDHLFVSQKMARIGTWETEADGTTVRISSGMKNILQCNQGVLALEKLIDRIHPGDRGEVREKLQEVHRTGYVEFEHRFILPGNRTATVLHQMREVRNADDNPVKVSGTIRDITAEKSTENEIRTLTVALQNSHDWIVITDTSGKIEYVNATVEHISGYPKEEILEHGMKIWKSGLHNPDFYKVLWETIRRGEPFTGLFICRNKKAELFYLEQTVTPVADATGRTIHYVGTGKDVTQAKQMEERLNHLSYYDALTNLPNRHLFTERLRSAILQAQRDRTSVAVINLDINRFRLINDSMGTKTGDEILKTMAARLSTVIRENDTVARIGNDEWGMVLTGIPQTKNIVQVIENALEETGKPITIGEEDVLLSLSAGIAVYPEDGTTSMDLVRNSEIALVQAKEDGKSAYRFFTADLNRKAFEFLQMERDLSRAVDNGEFILYYQPFFDLDTQTFRGMEGLLRWKRKGGEIISPAEFIPILEETGLIVKVGMEVIRMAAEQIGAWKQKGFDASPVAINLSALQFRQKDLAGSIESIIGKYGIEPSDITFEITESTFMQDLEYTRTTLMKLRDMGFHLSIDDFGTGYSSLSYLKRFPVNVVKIDKSFVADLAANGDDLSIVRAIISMAKSLNLKTTAEGVQDAGALSILKREGCDYAQGFFFSRPVPPEIIEAMIFGVKPIASDPTV